jgi:Arc/MetJ family transcription regulator
MARTTLDLDDKLVADTVQVSGARTKKAAIEEAMREYVNARRREALIAMIGSGAINMTLEELLEWRRQSAPRTEEYSPGNWRKPTPDHE